MFRRYKRADFVEENSKRKFLYNKEVTKKVKHLKLLIENLPTSELQKFLEEHHSEIFHNFFDYFDTELKSKISTLSYKEAEFQLFILEKLLVYLPERFNSQWQLNCIFHLVQDLLSSLNALPVQVNGIKIFLLWYQILGENAVADCTDLFIHLVPALGALYDAFKPTKCNARSYRSSNIGTSSQKLIRNVAFHSKMDSFLSDPSTLPTSERRNYILLRYLLRFAVSEVDKIQWCLNAFDRRPMCFWFIFEQLKKYYFPAIFPKISAKYSLYDGGVLPGMTNPSDYTLAPDGYIIPAPNLAIYQEEVVRWLSDFLYTGPRAFVPSLRFSSSVSDLRTQVGGDGSGFRNPNSSEGSTSGIDLNSQTDNPRSSTNVQEQRAIGLSVDSPLSTSCGETSLLQQHSQAASSVISPLQRHQRRNSAAITNLSIMEIRQTVPGYFAEHVVMAPHRTVFLEPVLPTLPEWGSEYSLTMISRVRDVLFYSRQNINLIHAVFYHASLLPIDRYKALLCLILVYRSWLEENPVFMKGSEAPCISTKGTSKSNIGTSSNLKDMRRRRESGLPVILPIKDPCKLSNNSSISSTHQSLPSYSYGDVGGCLQKTYQVMFTNLAHIFLRICPPPCAVTLELTDRVQETLVDFVTQQISLCTLILDTIIRPLTQSNVLSTESWERLLLTLMDVISEVMSKIYQTDKFDFHWVSNDKLLGKVFQTLNTACIYATLAAPISSAAWDRCLSIYSKSPNCPALVQEWEKAMDLLTRQLGKIVFGVDLTNLPDEKTKRGRRILGKLGSTSQYTCPSRVVARGRRDSADATIVDGDSSSPLTTKSTNKQELVNLNSPASTETSPQILDQEVLDVEFNLATCFDEADTVGFDATVESLSATDGMGTVYQETSASYDGCSSDVDYYPSEDRNFTSSIQTKINDDSTKGNEVYVTLISKNVGNKLVNKPHFFSADDLTSEDAPDFEKTEFFTKESQIKFSHTMMNDVSRMHNFAENEPSTEITCKISTEKISQAQTLKKPDQEYLKGVSVLAGGRELGWNVESATVCWRRFLGLLGDFTHLTNPSVTADVFTYLDSLTNSLLAIDSYQPLEVESDGTIKPPTKRPPINYLVPVYLKILQMPSEFIEGKKVAISTLRKVIIEQHDLEPSEELLAQFYRILHQLLTQKDCNFATEVIRSGCGRIFSYSLPACCLLILDFIQAIDDILCQPSSHDETLRAQAMSVLVTLLPFQHHFGKVKVFDPTLRELKVKEIDGIIQLIASRVLRGAVAETSELARQVAICGLLSMCYSTLTKHSASRFASAEKATSLHASLVTLLRCARLTSRPVAITATSMLCSLAECSETIFDVDPTYPILIVQALSWNLAFLWSQAYAEEKMSPTFKMLLITNISTLMEWTMKIPLPLLASPFVDLSKTRSKEITCLWVVFSVLEFISSSTPVNVEPEGPGWVPGCPISDPLACGGESKFFDELRPTGNFGERLSDTVVMFPDQRYFLTSDPLTPESVRMAARFARCQLFCQLGRYPLSSTNDLLDSRIQEHHDRKTTANKFYDDLTFESFDQPDVQIFVINRSFLISVFTVFSSSEKSDDRPPELEHALNAEAFRDDIVTGFTDVRVIVRDVAGKYSWDATHIYGVLSEAQKRAPSPPPRQCAPSFNLGAIELHAEEQNTRIKLDFLSKLLDDLASQHPECRSEIAAGKAYANATTKASDYLENSVFEKWGSEQIAAAIKKENRYLEYRSGIPQLPFYCGFNRDRTESDEVKQGSKYNQQYSLVKQLLCQLGFLSQSRRSSIELLKKSQGLVRELKNLDKQRSRQTYKIALVYIGPGQEGKHEILSNQRGSIEFERFVSNLGWPVNLANHQGFTGGLQYPEDGDTATYFASPVVEVVFHVSTRMPSVTEEDRHRMFKHLGNDEVMVIWTEHWRSFRRSSLRTEFGDVLIIISPLSNGLFRIEVRKAPEVPFFGPLVDGMLVLEEHLPFLVRSTAIQASNAINSRKPNFRENFEERYFYLQSIITNHMHCTTFENFVMQLALPKPPIDEEDSARGSAVAVSSTFSNSVNPDLISPNVSSKAFAQH